MVTSLHQRPGGHEGDEAPLEITLMGPSLLFTGDQVIALSGADLSARIGDEPMPLDRTVAVRAQDLTSANGYSGCE